MFPEWKSADLSHETDMPYPNGESGQDVWNRAKKVFGEIDELSLDNTAVVAHAGTIVSLICGALDIPQQKRFFLGYPPEFSSISVLQKRNRRYCLHQFNEYSGIEGLNFNG
jgi:probable phosphoglycerate mutase